MKQPDKIIKIIVLLHPTQHYCNKLAGNIQNSKIERVNKIGKLLRHLWSSLKITYSNY